VGFGTSVVVPATEQKRVVMTEERWQEIKSVLESAMELDSGKRQAYLDQACAADPSLRREVESLLAADQEARRSFLQLPPLPRKLEPGTRLEEYEIQSLLGAGGMGEVYRARDLLLRREVAIKVLPAMLSNDPERLRRFEQEATAAAALSHPNILAIHRLGSYAGAPYLVSELLEGETLREQLRRGRLGVRRAIDYAVQIAHGLTAAHEKGIVHRDLKPENVFISKDGRVKILDFGLAKLTQRQPVTEQSAPTISGDTESGMVMGTVGYMSPEQVRGEAADHRADIFSFGAMLYEMLTGKRAFQKPTWPETMSAILNEDPAEISQIAPNISPSLQRIVHRCLEKVPEQRFQSAADLTFALEALSDSSVTRNKLLGERSRSPWSWISILATALAVGVIAGLWMRRPSESASRSEWVQVTNLSDPVSQPALSSDSHMVAFVRGSSTFAATGQIYVKILPDGEPVQLTRDDLQKMSPVFSPDSSKIAYTAVPSETRWDSWLVPVLGGQPQLWLPNASGLGWLEKSKIMFSEIKNNDIQMAIITADESRANERDIYVPPGELGMAHRSYPSPDGHWALIAGMDRAIWLPCRLAPMSGNSRGRQVGPPSAGCTLAAWSPDGKWMYLSANASGNFHIWRQRFPDGQPEQITFGPGEEEGIAMAPDGKSFITAAGITQSAVWIHDSTGERQVSLEGYSYDVKFTPDGKKLCYRILKGSLPVSDPSELRVLDLDSGRSEALLAGFPVTGRWGVAYDVSADGRKVVAAVVDREGKYQLWVAPLDRGSPPRQIPNVEGQRALFGPGGEIFFRAIQGPSSFIYRVLEDGTGLRQAVTDDFGGHPTGISPDGKWLAVRVGGQGPIVVAYPLLGGSPLPILGPKACAGDPTVRWSADGRLFNISIPATSLGSIGRTYFIPVPRGRWFPQIPLGGFQSEAQIARLPGVRRIDAFDVAASTQPGVYALARESVQRNLFRVPLR
jgi:eukaryotic-like serine/threonine-protein kinase